MNEIRYFKDSIDSKDNHAINNGIYVPKKHNSTINSSIDIYNDATGECIYKGLKNKTVIAGAALTAMKLFGLDKTSLDNTPTYDENVCVKDRIRIIVNNDNDLNVSQNIDDINNNNSTIDINGGKY